MGTVTLPWTEHAPLSAVASPNWILLEARSAPSKPKSAIDTNRVRRHVKADLEINEP